MQTDHKELYTLTGLRTGNDEQIYKDIGIFMFNKLSKTLRRPNKLIIKLKGVGTWYLRKKRMEEALKWFPEDFDKTEKEFETEREVLRFENKKEVYRIFVDRLEDYKNYLAVRDSIRKIRYETQTLLEPINRED
jgi:hypothetical protein